jgi:phenylacetate-CoA ligase
VCLYGYATSIATFARHVREHKDSTRDLAVRKLQAVFVTGETLQDHDRRLIESMFGAPVVNEYGARDAGLLALQCPSGRLHVPAENVIVELLDASRETAAPVKPGETGEVVVTYLENFVMPFIRYRVGDLARRPPVSDGKCTCGRAHDVLAEVHGRVTDQILTRQDGQMKRMHALSLIYTLREADGVRQFRIIQSSLEAFTIQVVADEQFTAEQERRVTAKLHERLGSHVTIRFDRCQRIDAGSSGKHACVISHVA